MLPLFLRPFAALCAGSCIISTKSYVKPTESFKIPTESTKTPAESSKNPTKSCKIPNFGVVPGEGRSCILKLGSCIWKLNSCIRKLRFRNSHGWIRKLPQYSETRIPKIHKMYSETQICMLVELILRNLGGNVFGNSPAAPPHP